MSGQRRGTASVAMRTFVCSRCPAEAHHGRQYGLMCSPASRAVSHGEVAPVASSSGNVWPVGAVSRNDKRFFTRF